MKKNVLVLLWSSTIASGRDFLAGFAAPARRCAVCSEQTVVERESTAAVTPAAHLVSAAQSFIRQNATKAISAAKVARVCGFTDVPHLQVVFKRRFGLPMGQWRRQAADEGAHAP